MYTPKRHEGVRFAKESPKNIKTCGSLGHSHHALSMATDSNSINAEAPVLDFAKRLEEMHTELATEKANNRELAMYKARVDAMDAAQRIEREALWNGKITEFMTTLRENSAEFDNPNDKLTEETECQLKDAFLNPRAEFRGFHNFIAVAHKNFANSRSELEKYRLNEKRMSEKLSSLPGVPVEPAEMFSDSNKGFRSAPTPASAAVSSRQAPQYVGNGEFSGDQLIEAIFKQI